MAPLIQFKPKLMGPRWYELYSFMSDPRYRIKSERIHITICSKYWNGYWTGESIYYGIMVRIIGIYMHVNVLIATMSTYVLSELHYFVCIINLWIHTWRSCCRGWTILHYVQYIGELESYYAFHTNVGFVVLD